MDSAILIDSFSDFAKSKNVDRPTMIRILEDVFKTMIRKKFEYDDNFDIIINADKGDLEIWRFREIVDDNSEDIWDHDKISLSEARKIEPDFEIGEEVAEEVKGMGAPRLSPGGYPPSGPYGPGGKVVEIPEDGEICILPICDGWAVHLPGAEGFPCGPGGQAVAGI